MELVTGGYSMVSLILIFPVLAKCDRSPLLQYLLGMKDIRKLLVEKEGLCLLLIFIVFLGLRITVISQNPIAVGDGIASNLEMAENLSQGHGFSTMRKWTLYSPSMEPIRPEANRQPVLAVLLYAVFLVTGTAFLPAQILSIFLGVFCIWAIWRWARKVFGIIPAMITALVLTISPLFIWYSTQPDSLLLFTGILFLALHSADSPEISYRRVLLFGVIGGIAYLVRTQGALLALSFGVWILIKGGKGRILKAFVFSLIFLVICIPWFMRNIQAFGSPTYSQNSQFFLNENHWAAWEVRETAPAPTDMFEHQGLAAVAVYIARGVVRIFEPITIGTLHRSEIFGYPPLIGFFLLAVLVLHRKEIRKKMLFPLIASLPVMAVLALHEHSGRYLAFLVAITVALGSYGLAELSKTAKRKIIVFILFLLFVPFIVPVIQVVSADSGAKAPEAEEACNWIIENTEQDDWVVTFPNVELLIWKYRRPTLTMPNDYEMLLWQCLEDHNVKYIVIDEFTPLMRPHLSNRWSRTPDGTNWQRRNPPFFIEKVFESSSGKTMIYEMTDTVPDGFMFIDSLPRDNMRALPPSG